MTCNLGALTGGQSCMPFALCVGILGLLGGLLQAAEPLVLPTDAAAWINSQPLTTEMLAGKAVVFYFFEEGCPRVRGRWPELLKMSQQFAGRPVFFIGVNSGNSAAEVQQYVQQVGVPWPVIVDADRSFEKRCGVNEISLRDIYRVRLLMPAGELVAGGAKEADLSAATAVENAAWRVDPQGLPDALKPAWLQVEFANYAAAAAAIKGGVKSAKPEVKAGAERLQAAVTAAMQQRVDEAGRQLAAGEKWAAHQQFADITRRFKGFDLPGDMKQQMKDLAEDEAVRREIAAARKWESIQKSASSPSASALRTAVSQARQLVQEFPGTEAARSAEVMLERTDPKR